jgi:hypothetical protein
MQYYKKGGAKANCFLGDKGLLSNFLKEICSLSSLTLLRNVAIVVLRCRLLNAAVNIRTGLRI